MKQLFTFLLFAFATSASAQFIQCYEDNDHDGYGDPNKSHLGTAGFTCESYGWASNGFDCDDNAANVNPGVKWYRDADGDGYTDGSSLSSCLAPPGPYTKTPNRDLGGNLMIDCNDANNSLHPGSFWGYDNDGDGYFSDYKTQCQSPGLKWVLASSRPDDCNDNDPAIHGIRDWYLDQDNDGYPGSLAKYGPNCTAPPNYRPASEMITTSAIDCNDENPAVTNTRVYRDADGDGYTNGTFSNWCFGPGLFPPPFKYTTTPARDGSGNIIIDCNENDSLENSPFQGWYTDNDGDKHGTAFPLVIQCNRPAGYFARSELEDLNDCDANNPSVWQSGTLFIDIDGDGWNNGHQTMCYGNVPPGYALTSNGSDCNDNDPQVHTLQTFYWDDDHDGYGNPNIFVTSCAITPPRGYVGNGNDCDDDNALLTPQTIWYKDSDNDGYSDGASLNLCTRPTNYKLASALTATNGDCNDNNAAINPATTWYKDADNDGYSDGVTITQCARPPNYKLPSELIATTGDGDDANAAVNPTSPVARAGNDVSIKLPGNMVALDATGSSPGTTGSPIQRFAWSYVSGPSAFTFFDASSSLTSLYNLVQGTYQFRLTVTDQKGNSNTDDILITVLAPVVPGNTWTVQQPPAGTLPPPRNEAVSFTIAGKLYVGMGIDNAGYKKDFWQYDPQANTWTRLADLPGSGRTGAVGFSIGSKGYVATGSFGGYLKDLWQYDPQTNTWVQKADLPGVGRYRATSFVIGGKGYVVAGFNGGSYKKDCWQYDPLTNTWVQKADFAGGVRSNAASFTIADKAYMATGFDGAYKKDVWQYDPVINTWIRKGDFPGGTRLSTVGFAIGGKGYLGTGMDLAVRKKELWEYDPSVDTWVKKADFAGEARVYATGSSQSNQGYLGFGSTSTSIKNDLFAYTPSANLPAMNSVTSSQQKVSTSVAENFVPENILLITAHPNPSHGNFILEVKTTSKEQVTLHIRDLYGRLVATYSKPGGNTSVTFGGRLAAGTYFAEVVQGKERKVLKLVKQ